MLLKKRKPGRPKGSKDGPRKPGAPPRGRPTKKPRLEVNPSHSSPRMSSPDYDAFFDDEELTQDVLDLADELERQVRSTREGMEPSEDPPLERSPAGSPMDVDDATERNGPETMQVQLEAITASSQTFSDKPFFSPKGRRDNVGGEAQGEDGDDEADAGPPGKEKEKSVLSEAGEKVWFRKPARMSQWLYEWFGEVIHPIISRKDGNRLARPPSFLETRPYAPATLWIHPPDPIFMLHRGKLEPQKMQLPRVFLWLPHFFVAQLLCPSCRKPLEKNGKTPPRPIYDVEDNYYLISWQYACRMAGGCQRYFSGWSPALLSSLPAYIQHSFPAVLSHRGGVSRTIIPMLRAANQHKMGPAGVRALLLELHTRRYNLLLLQYLECAVEYIQGKDIANRASSGQSTLHSFAQADQALREFGDFDNQDGYAGRVPSEKYLTAIMNRAIEGDESDADQHTSLLPLDQLAIDDLHKINKHIAKVNKVSVFGALWTAMTSRYIRIQALCLTKAHAERIGPLRAVAASNERYGLPKLEIVYSNNPVPDKRLIYSAFPYLAKGVTSQGQLRGLEDFELPSTTRAIWLDRPYLIDATLQGLLGPLTLDPELTMVVGFDAEWNRSKKDGVSIIQLAPQLRCEDVYVIPVHKLRRLPVTLVNILTSPRIFKVGSAIKADVTQLKKQFSTQLTAPGTRINVVDLKSFAVQKGALKRSQSGSLNKLVELFTHKFLSKDESVRTCEEWEETPLARDLLQYAALDAFASLTVFEEINKLTPPPRITPATIPGTRITLYNQEEDGIPIAHAIVPDTQPTTYRGIRVHVQHNARMVIDITEVLEPSAAAILHLIPGTRHRRNKIGTYTLGQLAASSPSEQFSIVAPVAHLRFRKDTRGSPDPEDNLPTDAPENLGAPATDDIDDTSGSTSDVEEADFNENTFDDLDEAEALSMLDAFVSIRDLRCDDTPLIAGGLSSSESVRLLKRIVARPPDADYTFSPVKKDIFHCFDGLPISRTHSAAAPFLRTLSDHMLRWDPVIHEKVDRVCQKEFGFGFDVMLARDRKWCMRRVPRYVPSPSILVAALKHVYAMFGDIKDAKTGEPLFTPAVREKANTLLDLAAQGYLSDNPNKPPYEEAGVDKFGLTLYRCTRGSNVVEGGPHSDVYRKFSGTNAGPRTTVNCLTDHRTWYNLQALASHLYGTDWDYHHDLAMINRTDFLLKQLSGIIQGSTSYTGWVNGDLYERTEERFGLCPLPDVLREKYGMEPWSEPACARFKNLNDSDNWLRKRQGLALPVLPPTTIAARKYFFAKIISFTQTSERGTKKSNAVNFDGFAKEWNQTADGIERYYITPEVLGNYAKTWEKAMNIHATEELMYEQILATRESARIFAAADIPNAFPPDFTTRPYQEQPSQGQIVAPSLLYTTCRSEEHALQPPVQPPSPTFDDTHHELGPPIQSNTDPASPPLPTFSDIPPGSEPDPLLPCPASSAPQTRPSAPPPAPGPVATSSRVTLEDLPSQPQPPVPVPTPYNVPQDSALPLTDLPPSIQNRTSPRLKDSASQPLSPPPPTGSSNQKKRRREVPSDQRKRATVRKCRRCCKQDCAGQSNILDCPVECTRPCPVCLSTDCTGCDGGRMCSIRTIRIIRKSIRAADSARKQSDFEQ